MELTEDGTVQKYGKKNVYIVKDILFFHTIMNILDYLV